MFKLNRLSVLFVLILTVALVGSLGVVPAQAVSRGETSQPANIPVQVFPTSTIPLTRIVYVWTGVNGATKYQLQVAQGNTTLVNVEYGSGICASGTCNVKPARLLPNGSFTWRVRAYLNDAYQPYTAWQSFVVALPSTDGFLSPFTTDAAGWVVQKGTWSLEGGNYYVTNGLAAKASTISHAGEFSTLTYEVRMKRDGCIGCANVIIIRGNPALDADGWWKTEYTFDYTNNGLFSVWKDNNGTYTPLKNWTSTTAINQGGWNTLKVTASGKALKFYINDVLVWSGTDSAYAKGAVGLGMYRTSASTGDKLWVDWAELTTSVSANEMPVTVAPGIEMEGGDKNMAPQP